MSLGSCRTVVTLLVAVSLALAIGPISAEAGAHGQGKGGGNGGGADPPDGASGDRPGDSHADRRPAHAQERSERATSDRGGPPERAPPHEEQGPDPGPAGPDHPPREEDSGILQEEDDAAPLSVPPVARFTYEMDGPILVVDAIDSYHPDGVIRTYVWDWGDGQKIRGGDLEVHAYDDPFQEHRVTLTVVDDHGQTGSVTHRIAGWTEPLVASVEAWTDGSALIVDGFGSTAGPFLILKWSWDWGDGSPPSQGPIADHRYATPGSHTVTLTVQDEAGRVATAEHAVHVDTAPARPVVYRVSAVSDEATAGPMVFAASGPDASLFLLVGALALVTRWIRRPL